ncbi:hypothetical protein D9758_015773 [Tetrapyrgos nigripes]|uniref:Uncharacterized protein n=1 Tax=Tetrapyrgos nigripes TaxID=182062 RepID=A0A8H5FF75_9AGAR|nr:hypothetical protein D9758_015773 [Tetrapyrgos nigripes]
MLVSRGHSFLLCVLAIVAAALTYSLSQLSRAHTDLANSISSPRLLRPSKSLHYTYIGNDFPEFLPQESQQLVKLVVEDSVHYSLTNTSRKEWMAGMAGSKGMVRLGSQHRAFVVTMLHELHCLTYFHGVLTDTDAFFHAHMHHCLTYLLSMTLCDADLTLEPGDFAERNWTVDRVGETHFCRDWDDVFGTGLLNWIEWYTWKKAHDDDIEGHMVNGLIRSD